MEWRSAVRFTLLLGALIMFGYQSKKAVVLILAPPMMITAQQVDISEVPLPMLYICPMNQYNTSKLDDYKFKGEFDILDGKLEVSVTFPISSSNILFA